MHQDIQEVLLTREAIEAKSKELAAIIGRDYQGKNPIFLGLLKGCVMFMGDLLKSFEDELEVDFMDVSSYFGVESSGAVTILKDMTIPVKGRHIIIIEDIIDTGRTLEKVMSLLKNRGAASVEMVTLLDKPEARISAVMAKYVGFSIPNAFVVGYGLDYNEKYRNLPYIGILKKSIYL